MKLKTKTTITVILLSALIVGSLHALSYFVLQPSFDDLERQESIEKLNQAKNMLNYQISGLATEVSDYAFWDESYTFVQNQDFQYIDRNFIDSTFENLNLNLVTIVNENTDLLYCQFYDQNSSAKIQTSEEIKDRLISDNMLWDFQMSNEPISGILLVDNKPMLIATAPILTSTLDGPAVGGMLFGKYIDSQDRATLSGLVGFGISLSTFSDFRLNEDNKPIVDALLLNESIAQRKNNESSISGYSLISDIHSDAIFILQTTQNRVVYQQSTLVLNSFLYSALAFSIMFGLILLFLLEREIVKPMTKLAGYVEELSLNPNLPAPPVLKNAPDELVVVTDAVRDTLKRKLEGMNEVSIMVAHDLRNPLAGIRNANYFLRRKYSQAVGSDGDVMLMLQKIDECITYSDKVVQNLLDYSSEIKLDKIKVSSKSLVDMALSKFVLPGNVNLINEASDELLVSVDTTKIERVVTNIVSNAIDAMPNGGTLKITSKKVKGTIELKFSDTGIGMSKQVLDKLWTPFFTTKAKGLGIGLSICKRIIDTHQGKIKVQSVEGKGTCFSVFLPVTK